MSSLGKRLGLRSQELVEDRQAAPRPGSLVLPATVTVLSQVAARQQDGRGFIVGAQQLTFLTTVLKDPAASPREVVAACGALCGMVLGRALEQVLATEVLFSNGFTGIKSAPLCLLSPFNCDEGMLRQAATVYGSSLSFTSGRCRVARTTQTRKLAMEAEGPLTLGSGAGEVLAMEGACAVDLRLPEPPDKKQALGQLPFHVLLFVSCIAPAPIAAVLNSALQRPDAEPGGQLPNASQAGDPRQYDAGVPVKDVAAVVSELYAQGLDSARITLMSLVSHKDSLFSLASTFPDLNIVCSGLVHRPQ